VSRLVRAVGIAGVLLVLPNASFVTYAMVLSGAGFQAFRWTKTIENATDYSAMNTARQMLWLPTERREKYAAKQAADTFVVRVGDVLAAGLVLAGTTPDQGVSAAPVGSATDLVTEASRACSLRPSARRLAMANAVLSAIASRYSSGVTDRVRHGCSAV
jgi:hypothetical protein